VSHTCFNLKMGDLTEEIDKQILKKYEIQTKLGKGAYGVSEPATLTSAD